MRMGIDLHIHTNRSDGTLTPAEVVEEAAKKGLKAIAITDHDTTDGIDEALEAVKGYTALSVVPGIEISTEVEKTEVHILGYFIDHKIRWFLDFLVHLKNQRVIRIEKMAQKLQSLGMPMLKEDILRFSRHGSVGRPHVAQAMISKGYVKSIREAFEKYLKIGAPAYVQRYRISPEEAIGLIKRVNGIPVLAHPGLMGRDELIYRCADAGLMGLEVYYSEHTPLLVSHYMHIVKELGLLVTGGSDYHGYLAERPFPMGTPFVPYRYFEKLKIMANKLKPRW